MSGPDNLLQVALTSSHPLEHLNTYLSPLLPSAPPPLLDASPSQLSAPPHSSQLPLPDPRNSKSRVPGHVTSLDVTPRSRGNSVLPSRHVLAPSHLTSLFAMRFDPIFGVWFYLLFLCSLIRPFGFPVRSWLSHMSRASPAFPLF